MVCLCVCVCLSWNVAFWWISAMHTHFNLLRSHLPLALEIKSAEARSASQDKVGSVKKTNRKFLDDTWHTWHGGHRCKAESRYPSEFSIMHSNAHHTVQLHQLHLWINLGAEGYDCSSGVKPKEAIGHQLAVPLCIQMVPQLFVKFTYKSHVEMLLACISFLQTL